MAEIADKGCLLLMCLVLTMMFSFNITFIVILLLIALTVTALCGSLRSKRSVAALLLLFIAVMYGIPAGIFFAPLIIYELWKRKFDYYQMSIFCIFLIYPIWKLQDDKNLIVWGQWILVMFLAGWLAFQTRKREQLIQELMQTRDNDMELNLALRDKNRILMENKENEVHMATLQERNRIAREIHDHVGHMLTRSILQMGALEVVYREEPIHTQLSEVSGTLNQAMNSIRESVHDLHDEAVDLKQIVRQALAELNEKCHVSLDYSLSETIPKQVQYCFAATVKEAVSNILKHSDCTEVHVMLREHPAMYQLIVEDNGSNRRKEKNAPDGIAEVDRTRTGSAAPDAGRGAGSDDSRGIGLENMRERVESLHGHIRIDRENGFRIFISVPKK